MKILVDDPQLFPVEDAGHAQFGGLPLLQGSGSALAEDGR